MYANNVQFGTGVIMNVMTQYNGIPNGATGCTSAPTITVTGGGGSGAIAAAAGNNNGTVSGGGGSGITSINALNAVAQFMVTGSAGNDFNIVSAGATHTFNIPSASTTARGLG